MTFGLKDVAALAGVSVSTVSRVLRGIPVHPELDERVHAAVERLGYQPNGLAQALRAGRLGVIGLIVPDVANPWFAELARAIEVVSRNLGLGVALCNSDNRADQEEACLDLLWSRRVDGVLLVSVRGEPPRSLLERAARNWPVVAFDDSCAAPNIDVVPSDNEQGMRLMATHLAEVHGFRNISAIASSTKLVAADERLRALESQLQQHEIRLAHIAQGDFTFESGARALDDIWNARPDTQAVVALNDTMALGAIQRLAERELSVPSDVAVVGFDDMAVAAWTAAPLTTVRQDLDTLARSAIELLQGRMDDPGQPRRRRVVPTELRVRSSCGCRPSP